MEMQMGFQSYFLPLQEEEKKKNKENIPPFSSYSSASLFPFPHPRKPLQDITHLITSATQNGRFLPSAAEARAHLRLGVRSSSKKCSKKKAAGRLSSEGVVSSQLGRQRHEMPILRKMFR